VLSRAITAHAWTFAGSGRFTAVTPWQFELDDNPLIRGVTSDAPVCDWHRAVFQRLYKTLVARNVRCREVTCKAAGDPCCRFVLDRG
jgi:divinyl protochlorophyllide a 8-vinyl-reductase